jgi:hypothetical protein
VTEIEFNSWAKRNNFFLRLAGTSGSNFDLAMTFFFATAESFSGQIKYRETIWASLLSSSALLFLLVWARPEVKSTSGLCLNRLESLINFTFDFAGLSFSLDVVVTSLTMQHFRFNMLESFISNSLSRLCNFFFNLELYLRPHLFDNLFAFLSQVSGEQRKFDVVYLGARTEKEA